MIQTRLFSSLYPSSSLHPTVWKVRPPDRQTVMFHLLPTCPQGFLLDQGHTWLIIMSRARDICGIFIHCFLQTKGFKTVHNENSDFSLENNHKFKLFNDSVERRHSWLMTSSFDEWQSFSRRKRQKLHLGKYAVFVLNIGPFHYLVELRLHNTIALMPVRLCILWFILQLSQNP